MRNTLPLPAGALLLLLISSPLLAQAPPPAEAAAPAVDWKTATELPQVDFSNLSAEQKEQALTIMRDEGCNCGCGMKIAECRINDRNCPRSPGLAATVVKGVATGQTLEAIQAALAAPPPQPAQPPQPMPPPQTTQGGRLVGEAADIPIDGAPFKGPKKAKVTIVEFSDFQCPHCARAVPWVESILDEYPKDVRVVFKQYPLAMHRQAKLAAQASLAAHSQGKFWEMHDKLFANYQQITRQNMDLWATDLGLDLDEFNKELDEEVHAKTVETDLEQGTKAGVRGTPAFFVNGRLYQGPRTLEAIKPVIDEELK